MLETVKKGSSFLIVGLLLLASALVSLAQLNLKVGSVCALLAVLAFWLAFGGLSK